jgi:sugar lactone lactonase YvrE
MQHPPLLVRALGALLLALVVPLGAQIRVLAPEPPAGLLTAWELSPPFRPNTLAAESFPTDRAWRALAWTQAQSDSAGLVDLALLVPSRPEGATRIWARTTLRADRKETRALRLGYSDALSLFLNGRMIFQGRNTPRPAGAAPAPPLCCDNTIYLPLEPGANELTLAISATPAGWAFKARDADAINLAPGVEPLWELTGKLPAPESVAYDRARDLFYVSNFNGDSIAAIHADGRLLALNWAGGLKRPTGLKIHDGKLYAVERTGVAVIDLATGNITTRVPLTGAKFPNDLAFDDHGTLYVTDSGANRIYRVSGDQAELWLEDAALGKPNGIHCDPGRLITGNTRDGTLQAVDLATRTISPCATLGADFYPDGLTGDGAGGHLLSDYYGRIYRLSSGGAFTLLLDRRGPQRFCADFVFVPETGLLVVPSLYDHRLTAYRCKWETP